MYRTSKKPAHQVLTFSSFSQGMLPARQKTWKRIFVGTQLSLKSMQPHFKSEDCDAFRDRSTHRNAPSEILGEVAPGSSHMSSHSEELKILSVYGKGEGPLAVDGHDTLFTASEVEALNSLSADHSVAKSLERGERLVCREELSVQLDSTRHGSSTGRFPPQIVPPGRGRSRLRERAVTYFCTRRKQHLRNPHMDRTHMTTMEDIDAMVFVLLGLVLFVRRKREESQTMLAIASMVAMSLS
ncbi:unnamed protein product [Arctogadus glacialis]